jgi:hypothetical protein
VRFTYTVSVEVSRIEGKFASRDELGEQIAEAIESADPGSLSGDNGGEYEVVSWEVTGND